MDFSGKGRHTTISDGVDNGVVDTVGRQSRRRGETGKEGRNRTDAVQGRPLHKREREGHAPTERRLVLEDAGERTQYATGTTK